MEAQVVTLNSGMEYKSDGWGERCKALIKARGLNLSQFSERLDRPQPTFSKWLNLHREPTLAEFEDIAQELTALKPEAPVFAGYLAFGYPTMTELTAAMNIVAGAHERAAAPPTHKSADILRMPKATRGRKSQPKRPRKKA